MIRSNTTIIFVVIIVAQFCGTSLWFAGNAILPQLQELYHWSDSSLGYLTSSIQLGFIIGTLVFAINGISDRFSPSKVFFACCLLGGVSNVLVLLDSSSLTVALISRSLCGFFLAGIYPVGMKIAADWQERGLGNWLGSLVGALVLGTAFPHALKLFPTLSHHTLVIISISAISITGGILLLTVVPDGPYRKSATAFSFSGLKSAFKSSAFKSPAFGYFGHMWELYAFWAFVPFALVLYSSRYAVALQSSWSFFIIASGAVGCVIGGVASKKIGSYPIAFFALLTSGLCCLLSPWIFQLANVELFIIFMVVWGIFVVTDSPQFSTLVAQNAPPEVKGSAITLVTCIGFAITIITIQLLSVLSNSLQEFTFLILLPGPILGLITMRHYKTN